VAWLSTMRHRTATSELVASVCSQWELKIFLTHSDEIHNGTGKKGTALVDLAELWTAYDKGAVDKVRCKGSRKPLTLPLVLNCAES